MSTLMIFVAGILIGWLVEWVIDWLYWRRVYADLRRQLQASQVASASVRDDSAEIEKLRQALSQAEAKANRSEMELTKQNATLQQVTMAQTEVAQCRQQLSEVQAELNHCQTELTEAETYRHKLATAEAEIDRLKAELTNLPAQGMQVIEKVIVRDNLERINGIGPVFAQRLNKANILTFDQLAALSPERVNEIIAPQPWQQIDPDAWIAEAKAFTNSTKNKG